MKTDFLSMSPWPDSAPVPKYYQVKQAMLDRIVSGSWKAGDEIPPESDLIAEYHVSRGTLRRAIDDLTKLGLLQPTQGRSTTVSTPRIPIFSKGFRADIRNAGREARCTILGYHNIGSVQTLDEVLGLSKGEEVFELRRIIFADKEPIIVETIYLPAVYGSQIDEHELLSTSLLDLLPKNCHVILKKAIESFEPIVLNADEARLLDVAENALAILDQAVTYDINDRALFLSKAVIRRNRARIVTEVTFHI